MGKVKEQANQERVNRGMTWEQFLKWKQSELNKSNKINSKRLKEQRK